MGIDDTAPQPSAMPRNSNEARLIQLIQNWQGEEVRSFRGIRSRFILEFGMFFDPPPLKKRPGNNYMSGIFDSVQRLALSEQDYLYVEGIVATGGSSLSVEHPWCVVNHYDVVDFTYEGRGLAYYGVSFDRETLETHIANYGLGTPILRPEFFQLESDD